MGDKKIRISEDLYEQIQKLSEKSNKSMRELVEEAIKAYLLGTENIDKPIKSISGKVIPLRYSSKCHVCGKSINQGELAYWAKYTYTDNTTRSFVICLDCYYKDTALAEWYLKKRKLEAIVRGLKKKADEIAKEIEILKQQKKIEELKTEIILVWNTLKRKISSNEVSNIEDLIDKINYVIDKIIEIESMITTQRLRKKSKISRAMRYVQ